MKKITITLFTTVLILTGCQRSGETPPVVIWKSNRSFTNNPLEPCICRFGYSTVKDESIVNEFSDSCNKYNVRDTIIGKKRNF